MAEQIPDRLGERAIRRDQHARLRFVPNLTLFEGLTPFLQNTESIQRMGQRGLFLYSVASIPVAHRPYSNGFDPGAGFIDISQIDRVDHDLKHMVSNDQHMPMSEELRFAKTDIGGIAIQMAVHLNPHAAQVLEGTPFVAEDGRSVDVTLKLVPGAHAPGSVMRHAAQGLDGVLKREYPRAGTESVELVVT